MFEGNFVRFRMCMLCRSYSTVLPHNISITTFITPFWNIKLMKLNLFTCKQKQYKYLYLWPQYTIQQVQGKVICVNEERIMNTTNTYTQHAINHKPAVVLECGTLKLGFLETNRGTVLGTNKNN